MIISFFDEKIREKFIKKMILQKILNDNERKILDNILLITLKKLLKM